MNWYWSLHGINQQDTSASEIRLKLVDLDIIKVPFDFFIENTDNYYFVEVKTSKTKYYDFSDTQQIGLIAAKKLRIQIYFLWFRLQKINFNKNIPKFELWEINDFKVRQIQGTKEFKLNISDRFCNKKIYDLVINKNYHDCINFDYY